MDGEILIQRCRPPIRSTFSGAISYAIGMLESSPSTYVNTITSPGDGFTLDVDDIGINDANGAVNNTWLGPGSVRTARPASVSFSNRFAAGEWQNMTNNQAAWTIPHDPLIEPGPVDPLNPTFGGPDLGLIDFGPLPTADSRPEYEKNHERKVSSTGADWHYHNPTSDAGYTYEYDWPRKNRVPNEELTVTFEALESTAGISMVQAVWVGASVKPNMEGQNPPAIPGKVVSQALLPLGAASSTGNLNDYESWDAGLDVSGNMQQQQGKIHEAPAVGGALQLYMKEYFVHAHKPLHQVSETIDGETVIVREAEVRDPVGNPQADWYVEWEIWAAGVNYEYGTEPQPELPKCKNFMDVV
jgi:hypothetical protein